MFSDAAPEGGVGAFSTRKKASMAWDIMDADKDGSLTREEVLTSLQTSLDTDKKLADMLGLPPNVDLDMLFSVMDDDGGGTVSKGEFSEFFIVNKRLVATCVKAAQIGVGQR